jgi:hypothetical protein
MNDNNEPFANFTLEADANSVTVGDLAPDTVYREAKFEHFYQTQLYGSDSNMSFDTLLLTFNLNCLKRAQIEQIHQGSRRRLQPPGHRTLQRARTYPGQPRPAHVHAHAGHHPRDGGRHDIIHQFCRRPKRHQSRIGSRFGPGTSRAVVCGGGVSGLRRPPRGRRRRDLSQEEEEGNKDDGKKHGRALQR